MWTLPHFENLFRALDPARPCALTTYSRSTLIRATLLLAGFHVGVGHATGLKEETTVAANVPALAASETYAQLRQFRGKVHFSRSLADLKVDR